MKKVWKFTIPVGGGDVEMPDGAHILSVGADAENVYVWALVNPQATARSYPFIVTGTGMEVPDRAGYIGRATMDGEFGRFEWHVWVPR